MRGAREGACGGSPRCSAEPNESEAPRGVRLRGELADGSEAQFPSSGVRKGDGVGTRFRVLTRGDLSASVAEVARVAVKNERTTWRRDERSRMVA